MAHGLSGVSQWITSLSESNFDVYGAEGVLEMGTYIMGELETSGFATAYYSGDSSWRFADSAAVPDYFAATRQAVDRGCSISRTYVVDTEAQIDEVAFRHRAWADSSGGLSISYILTRDLPDPDARDFGLWDDSLLGEIEYALDPDKRPRLHRCRYFADDFHVRRAQTWRSVIKGHALPCPDLPSERALLEESAGAVEICCNGQWANRDCGPYHGNWQRLRQLDLVSTPRWHRDFYSRAIRAWSANAQQQVAPRHFDLLITGLADYGMLYWLAQSIPQHVRVDCTFHVLDICQTPLESCRWLEHRLAQCNPPLQLELDIHRQSIFANELPDDSIDLIASDAFLTRFKEDEEKGAVIAEWMRLLRPGGRVVTTTRLQEREGDIQDSDRHRFVRRAGHAADAAGLGHLAGEITQAAESYANFITSYPFTSTTHLSDTLPPDAIVSYTSLDEREMVPGRYAHVEVLT
jgi:SAM-dependent methyltransferase